MNDMVITNIRDVFTVVSSRGRVFEMHNRPSYGLSFSLGGEIIYTQNGKEYISDRDHAVLLPMGADYTLRDTKGGDFPLINFYADDFLLKEISVIKLSKPNLYIRDFEKMLTLSFKNDSRLEMISLLYSIMSRLQSEYINTSDLLSLIVKYINDNYHNVELSNDVIAYHAGISEVYLRRIFRNSVGISPKQYILNLRIRKAKQLLCEYNKKISDVSFECGFSSLHHFCRAFKKITSYTPGEYRQHSRKNVI